MSKTPTQIKSKARAYTDSALKVLAEIMNDPSAPVGVRASAATQILNRGYGTCHGVEKFILDRREFYVYSIHAKDGSLIYIGKGIGRRSFQSARRLDGTARIRAMFTSEKQALAFESRLIRRFRPAANIIHNRGDEISLGQRLN